MPEHPGTSARRIARAAGVPLPPAPPTFSVTENAVDQALKVSRGQPPRADQQPARQLVVECIQACIACAETSAASVSLTTHGHDYEQESYGNPDPAAQPFQSLTSITLASLDCAEVCEATHKLLSLRTTEHSGREWHVASAQLLACLAACREAAAVASPTAEQVLYPRALVLDCHRCIEACSALLEALPVPPPPTGTYIAPGSPA
jgi:hypothetical protein